MRPAGRTRTTPRARSLRKIFSRCDLKFRAVEADTGAIGGSQSHEFQVLAESGEDAIVSCNKCEYAANVQKAEIKPSDLRAAISAKAHPSSRRFQLPARKALRR